MLGYFHGVLESTLNEYLNLISIKHGIKFSELKDLMNEVKGNTGGDVLLPPPVVAVVKKVTNPHPVQAGTCGYIAQRGKNAGIVCGKKAKKESDFCSVHSKKTGTVATIEVETKNEPVPKKPNPVLRKNHIIGKWWHPDSGLVFKSSDEKIVIGIYKDDQLVDLTEEDVATCISYKFKYVTKRKRTADDHDDHEDTAEQHKKQKVEKTAVNVIDEQFIKVNQDAKNVEVIIKEMFNTKSNEDDDDADDEEHDDPIPGWDDNGAEETKENYTVQVDDDENDDVVEEEDEEEELLLEEDDS
jgi:hypothetical protein